MDRLKAFILLFTLPALPLLANAQAPTKYIELLDYVQPAPNQGQSKTCLYVASTGAMELLANKKNGVKDPVPYGEYDLSESFLIHAPLYSSKDKYFWEKPVLKFNRGYGIHVDDWPFDPFEDGRNSDEVWNYQNWTRMKKIKLPKVDTTPLFVVGNRWSTNVLKESHVSKIKEALWKYKSPILINYNDNSFWHVVLIVGYDDDLPGTCFDIPESKCRDDVGSFYVRDSFGASVEIRDYDWFRIKANAAFVVTEKK